MRPIFGGSFTPRAGNAIIFFAGWQMPMTHPDTRSMVVWYFTGGIDAQPFARA
jgi:hypothetical protein